jgi:hypothetical protein
MRGAYHIPECLSLALSLQRQYERWGPELAIGELMRMAVLEDPSEAIVFAVSRMLFVSKDQKPLRSPGLGEPWFLGDTEASDWPWQPIHLYRGVPFYILRGTSLAGLPEHPSWYLAHCLLKGTWNESPFPMVEQEELVSLAQEFIQDGPWRRALRPDEREFLLTQITPATPQPKADLVAPLLA